MMPRTIEEFEDAVIKRHEISKVGSTSIGFTADKQAKEVEYQRAKAALVTYLGGKIPGAMPVPLWEAKLHQGFIMGAAMTFDDERKGWLLSAAKTLNTLIQGYGDEDR